MRTYLKLAWRNLWRNSRRTFITVSSVMFAVILAMFMESMERGSWEQMIDNMARFHTGYIQVQHELFEGEPSLDNAFWFDYAIGDEILAAAGDGASLLPRIETFMLAAGPNQTRGSFVMGIDPEAEHRFNGLGDRLISGNFPEPGSNGAVLGSGLANRLNLAPGDTLVLLGQGRFGMVAAGLYPISGLVEHPIRDFDNQIVYLSLEDAQWLLSAEGHITGLLVTPPGARQAARMAGNIKTALDEGDELVVLTWQEMMPELLEAMSADIAGTRIFMGILYVVIGFGLFGTILTMTLERLREFGILLSVGMKRIRLAIVVQIETFLISLIGVVAGLFLGYFILLFFRYNPIPISGDLADMFLEMGFEPILIFSLDPVVFYLQGIIILIIALAISLYPTFKIFRLNILEASRS